MRNDYLTRSVPALLLCLASCVHAQSGLTGGSNSESSSLSVSDRLWVSGQANFITQYNPSFPAKYSGPNSFGPAAQTAASRVLTLYTGMRLTKNTEVLFDLRAQGALD